VIAEIEISGAPERVFQALTDPQQLFTWWTAVPSVELSRFTMEARKGGRYPYSGRPRPGKDFGPITESLPQNGEVIFDCHGEALEIDPPHMPIGMNICATRHHRAQGPKAHKKRHPSFVTHSELANEPQSRKDCGSGWQGVLQLLKGFF
jgi:hypothetical protein